MRVSAAIFALALTAFTPSFSPAAELVFVEIKSCVYCIRFNKQMAATYQASAFGRTAPLRRVNLMNRWPEDLANVDRPPYTPVFILVESGRELGRFNGYMNPAQFNRAIKRLMRKIAR